MKRLFLTAIFAIATVGYAQPGDRERLTPEQRVELQTKRLALDLNLTDAQQKEVRAALAEQNSFYQKNLEARKQKKSDAKPTADERFKNKSEMLDRQIAHKAKMKKILSPEQFAKWEKSQKNRAEKSRDMMARHKKSRGDGHRK